MPVLDSSFSPFFDSVFGGSFPLGISLAGSVGFGISLAGSGVNGAGATALGTGGRAHEDGSAVVAHVTGHVAACTNTGVDGVWQKRAFSFAKSPGLLGSQIAVVKPVNTG
jgi:hypothetical protein